MSPTHLLQALCACTIQIPVPDVVGLLHLECRAFLYTCSVYLTMSMTKLWSGLLTVKVCCSCPCPCWNSKLLVKDGPYLIKKPPRTGLLPEQSGWGNRLSGQWCSERRQFIQCGYKRPLRKSRMSVS